MMNVIKLSLTSYLLILSALTAAVSRAEPPAISGYSKQSTTSTDGNGGESGGGGHRAEHIFLAAQAKVVTLVGSYTFEMIDQLPLAPIAKNWLKQEGNLALLQGFVASTLRFQFEPCVYEGEHKGVCHDLSDPSNPAIIVSTSHNEATSEETAFELVIHDAGHLVDEWKKINNTKISLTPHSTLRLLGNEIRNKGMPRCPKDKGLPVGFRCQTEAGFVLEKISHPGFGDSWKDESAGVIWSPIYDGDSVDGDVMDYCKNLGGEVPTRRDFEKRHAHGILDLGLWLEEEAYFIDTPGTYADKCGNKVVYDRFGTVDEEGGEVEWHSTKFCNWRVICVSRTK